MSRNRSFSNQAENSRGGLFSDDEQQRQALGTLEKSSKIIILASLDAHAQAVVSNVPKASDITGINIMDMTDIFEQSLVNMTGFHTKESARQSSQILLRNLFDDIYKNNRCSKCLCFVLDGIEIKEGDLLKFVDCVILCANCCVVESSFPPSTPFSSPQEQPVIFDLTLDK